MKHGIGVHATNARKVYSVKFQQNLLENPNISA